MELITDEAEIMKPRSDNKDALSSSRVATLKRYIWPLVCVALITGIGKILDPYFDSINLALLYLLPVLVSAVRWGRGPSFLASFLGLLALDFFFVPPVGSLAVSGVRYVFILAVFLLVALITGTMAARLRDETQRALEREKKTLALYALGREIAAEADLAKVLEVFVTTIARTIEGEIIILMPESGSDHLYAVASAPPHLSSPTDKEWAVAYWVLDHGRAAGKGTEILRGAERTFLPVSVEDKVLAVLALTLNVTDEISWEQRQLIQAFANLGAVAIIRVQLAKEAEHAKWLVESEKLHAALLNSISHDLRTPLASITGAVTSLLSQENVYDQEARQILLETIKEGAQRMNHFVANLLDMVRLEGGMLKLNKKWCDIQDILGVVFREMKDILQGHHLLVNIPPDLPLVEADFALIEHVLINLLENAAKYSPPDSQISLSACCDDKLLRFTITDLSPPVPAKERERIFDKFYRVHSTRQIGGTGLGLSICKGIVEAHGGKIWVQPNRGYGNEFTFSLPLDKRPSQESDVNKGGDYAT